MSAPQKRVNLKILSKILHKEQPALLELENQVQAKVLIFLNRIFLFFVLFTIFVSTRYFSINIHIFPSFVAILYNNYTIKNL